MSNSPRGRRRRSIARRRPSTASIFGAQKHLEKLTSYLEGAKPWPAGVVYFIAPNRAASSVSRVGIFIAHSLARLFANPASTPFSPRPSCLPLTPKRRQGFNAGIAWPPTSFYFNKKHIRFAAVSGRRIFIPSLRNNSAPGHRGGIDIGADISRWWLSAAHSGVRACVSSGGAPKSRIESEFLPFRRNQREKRRRMSPSISSRNLPAAEISGR